MLLGRLCASGAVAMTAKSRPKTGTTRYLKCEECGEATPIAEMVECLRCHILVCPACFGPAEMDFCGGCEKSAAWTESFIAKFCTLCAAMNCHSDARAYAIKKEMEAMLKDRPEGEPHARDES